MGSSAADGMADVCDCAPCVVDGGAVDCVSLEAVPGVVIVVVVDSRIATDRAAFARAKTGDALSRARRPDPMTTSGALKRQPGRAEHVFVSKGLRECGEFDDIG